MPCAIEASYWCCCDIPTEVSVGESSHFSVPCFHLFAQHPLDVSRFYSFDGWVFSYSLKKKSAVIATALFCFDSKYFLYCHITFVLMSYSIVIKTMFSLPDTLNLCTQAAAWSVHRNYWFPFLRSPIRQEERCAQYPVTESPSLAIWYFLLNAGSCLGFDSQALEGIRWFPQERMFSVQGSHLLLSLLFFIYPENHFLNTFL